MAFDKPWGQIKFVEVDSQIRFVLVVEWDQDEYICELKLDYLWRQLRTYGRWSYRHYGLGTCFSLLVIRGNWKIADFTCNDIQIRNGCEWGGAEWYLFLPIDFCPGKSWEVFGWSRVRSPSILSLLLLCGFLSGRGWWLRIPYGIFASTSLLLQLLKIMGITIIFLFFLTGRGQGWESFFFSFPSFFNFFLLLQLRTNLKSILVNTIVAINIISTRKRVVVSHQS